MNAILKYPGGKWRIAQWIISHFPPHKVYCEPFFGSGAVFFTKSPCRIETINDIDGDVVNLFRVCRDSPEELARVLELTPWSREEFLSCREKSADPVEQARRTVVRSVLCDVRSLSEQLAELTNRYRPALCGNVESLAGNRPENVRALKASANRERRRDRAHQTV